jgi:hypothetical protein
MDPGAVTATSFSGDLNGVPVDGAITVGTGPTLFETFFVPSPSLGKSTKDNTSPQHSYAGIYAFAESSTDRIGYESVATAGPISAHVHVTFGGVVLDPIISVANVDLSYFDFASNVANGMTGMTILSGNGGGDGLFLAGTIISDLVPTTVDFTPDSPAPPTAGSRSAYGSVQIFGVFTALDFDIKNDFLLGPAASIDNATFTFVPEPGSALLAMIGGASLVGFARRRHRQA